MVTVWVITNQSVYKIYIIIISSNSYKTKTFSRRYQLETDSIWGISENFTIKRKFCGLKSSKSNKNKKARHLPDEYTCALPSFELPDWKWSCRGTSFEFYLIKKIDDITIIFPHGLGFNENSMFFRTPCLVSLYDWNSKRRR